MRSSSTVKAAFMCATALGACSLARPAAAQTDTRIQTIEQHIKALQDQLSQVKSDLAARDRALKAVQEQSAKNAAQAAATQAVTTAPAAAAAPPMPPGQFKVGALTVTLGGFAAVEGIYRSRNEAASIDSSFGGIPLSNSPNNHIGEFRQTAQQSRFSLLTEGNLDPVQKLTGYFETDFLSAGSSSNSNESNSYTLRVRQFWGNYDNAAWGLHVLGGQAWSLATMYKNGLTPRQESVPLTIDAQYVVGFNWARQAEVRVVKDFGGIFSAGLSLEEPQTTFNGAAGPNCLTGAAAGTGGGGTLNYAACGGPNVNSIQSYSNNLAPDIIAKIVADPGFGHYELYGLLRFIDGRVSYAATGTGSNHSTTGEGIGGGMILPLLPGKLDFQVSGLIGQGIGRYGSAQIADTGFSSTGKVEPLAAYAVMGGFVGHPIPEVDIYAYGGAEGVNSKSSGTGGYGNPNSVIGTCAELSGCAAVTSNVVEGTVGAWWRPIKSIYGTMQVGVQYEYVNRNTFSGLVAAGGTKTIAPSANENMFLFSMRYYPFQ
jgi:hypothetical protein